MIGCTLTQNNSLFGGIGELVLSPPVVALLDAGVRPQVLDGLHVRRIECGDRLEVDALHQLGGLL